MWHRMHFLDLHDWGGLTHTQLQKKSLIIVHAKIIFGGKSFCIFRKENLKLIARAHAGLASYLVSQSRFIIRKILSEMSYSLSLKAV